MPALYIYLIIAAASAVGGFWAGNQWRASDYHDLEMSIAQAKIDAAQAQTTAVQKARDQEREMQNGLTIELNQVRDEKEKLEAENERLANLPPERVTIRVPVKSVCVQRDASSADESNGDSAELTAAARQDYFNLRAMIINVNEILSACQAYARQCNKLNGD